MVRAGQSEVFVFYSGHGVPGEAGSGFLLPVDGDPGKAQLTGYGIETLVGNLNKLKARTVNLALDTCFSGLSQGGALACSSASALRLASSSVLAFVRFLVAEHRSKLGLGGILQIDDVPLTVCGATPKWPTIIRPEDFS